MKVANKFLSCLFIKLFLLSSPSFAQDGRAELACDCIVGTRTLKKQTWMEWEEGHYTNCDEVWEVCKKIPADEDRACARFRADRMDHGVPIPPDPALLGMFGYKTLVCVNPH